MKKFQDHFYFMAAVGSYGETGELLRQLSGQFTTCTCGHYWDHGQYTTGPCGGKRWLWYNGNQHGVPAFRKLATPSEINKWPELAHARSLHRYEQHRVADVLWVRRDMRDQFSIAA